MGERGKLFFPPSFFSHSPSFFLVSIQAPVSKVRLSPSSRNYGGVLALEMAGGSFEQPVALVTRWITINPFTPESDQCQNPPAASQEIWHHTVWRTWLFIAYSDEKWLYYKFSLHHSYNRFLKGWENTLFELRSERVKTNFGSGQGPALCSARTLC